MRRAGNHIVSAILEYWRKDKGLLHEVRISTCRWNSHLYSFSTENRISAVWKLLRNRLFLYHLKLLLILHHLMFSLLSLNRWMCGDWWSVTQKAWSILPFKHHKLSLKDFRIPVVRNFRSWSSHHWFTTLRRKVELKLENSRRNFRFESQSRVIQVQFKPITDVYQWSFGRRKHALLNCDVLETQLLLALFMNLFYQSSNVSEDTQIDFYVSVFNLVMSHSCT